MSKVIQDRAPTQEATMSFFHMYEKLISILY